MKPRLEMKVEVMEAEKDMFLASCHELNHAFAGHVVFEFRICSGHPVLAKEYFMALNESQWTVVKLDIKEAVHPERLSREELDLLRIEAAGGVVEYLQRYVSEQVIEPSDKVKLAMKNLKRVTEGGPNTMAPQIPEHLREFMVDQFSEMLLVMRSARNAYAADSIADTVIKALTHYNLLEDTDAQKSFLN